MRCPVCMADLCQSAPGEFGLVILDVCPNCNGAWYDPGELDRLDGNVWANVEEYSFETTESDHPYAFCPRCHTHLEAVSARGDLDLTLDRCPDCKGFWLDAGELHQVRTLALIIDSRPQSGSCGRKKPAGWSALRWRIHQRKTRGADGARS